MLVNTRNPVGITKEFSQTSINIDAGSTTIKVLSNGGFSAFDYIVIGAVGQDQSELRQISSISSSDTIIINSALSFSHGNGTSIFIIPYNQLEVSRKTTASGTFSVLATINLKVDNEFTTYEDVSGQTTYFYRIRLFNSYSGQYTSYSAVRAGTGPTTKEVSKMIDMIALQVEDPQHQYTTRTQILDYINYGYQDVVNAIVQATPSYFQKKVEYQMLDYVHEYTLPDDFKEVQEVRNNDDLIVFPNPRNVLFEGDQGYELTGLNTIYFNSVPTPNDVTASSQPVIVLANNAYSENGTWVASLDATNVQTNNDTFKTGVGSVSFDIDVSLDTSSTAVMTNSTFSPVDLSSYYNNGKWRVWMYLPDTTYITSVTLAWGPSSTKYWSLAVTKDYKNHAIHNGWNLLEFDWASDNVTTVGSPLSTDATAINYAQFTVTYSVLQGDLAGFLLDAMYMASSYNSNSTYEVTYIYQPAILVNEMDEVMLPPGNQGLLVNYAVAKILFRKGERDTLAEQLMNDFKAQISRFISQSAKRTRRMIHMRPSGAKRRYHARGDGQLVSRDQDFIVKI